MQLSDCLMPFIKILQVFGLAPYSRDPGTFKWKPSHLNKIITITLLIACIVNLFIVFGFYSTIFYSPSSKVVLAIRVYAMQMMFNHVILILIETLYKPTYHIKLLNLFEHFESMFKQYSGVQLDYAGVRINLYRVISYWLFQSIGLWISNILTCETMNDLYFDVAYELPYLITRLSYFYWIVLVDILYTNVKALLEYIQTYRENIDNVDISFVSQCYSFIWDASNLINRIVFWSLSIGLLNEFSVLIFNGFFLIQTANLLPNISITYLIHVSCCTLSNLINIFLLTSACQRTLDAVISSN